MDATAFHLGRAREFLLPSGVKVHFQNLTYDGDDLQIETDTFRSRRGVCTSRKSGKPQLHVNFNASERGILQEVENFVKTRVELPADLLRNGSDLQKIYKPLYHGNSAFMYFSPDFEGFDYYGKLLPENCNYGPGTYKVLFHVEGLYIGPHGSTPYLASLRCRILQLLYMPIRGVCRLQLPQMTGPELPMEASTETEAQVDPFPLNFLFTDEDLPPTLPTESGSAPPVCPGAPKKRRGVGSVPNETETKVPKRRTEKHSATSEKEKKDSSNTIDTVIDVVLGAS